jgi:ABC-type glycerol-3-phosphate transport system substrate-binding protein
MRANAMVWGRRGLSLVLAAILLAGCAGFSLPDLFAKPVTLGFLYLEGAANYQPLADEFHRLHPGITVKLIPVTYDNFQSQAAVADMIRLPNSLLTDDLVKNLLKLDNQISIDPNFPKSDLFPGSLEALQLGGKQIGIPAGLEPMVVYYSPRKFAAAGVKPPGPD